MPAPTEFLQSALKHKAVVETFVCYKSVSMLCHSCTHRNMAFTRIFAKQTVPMLEGHFAIGLRIRSLSVALSQVWCPVKSGRNSIYLAVLTAQIDLYTHV